MLIILALSRPRQDNHGLVWARLAIWAIARLYLKINKSQKKKRNLLVYYHCFEVPWQIVPKIQLLLLPPGGNTLTHRNTVSSSGCPKQFLPTVVTEGILTLILRPFPTLQLSKTLRVWSLLSWNITHLRGEKMLSTYASALKRQGGEIRSWLVAREAAHKQR